MNQEIIKSSSLYFSFCICVVLYVQLFVILFFSPTVDKYSCGCYIRVTDSTATLDSWSKSESGVVPSQITRAIADAKMHESQVDRSFFCVLFQHGTVPCMPFLPFTYALNRQGRPSSIGEAQRGSTLRSSGPGRAGSDQPWLGRHVRGLARCLARHGTAGSGRHPGGPMID